MKMKYLTENFFASLVPAVRNKHTGVVTIGKRGDYHSTVMLKTKPPKKHWSFQGSLESDELHYFLQHDRGYYNTKTKKFLTRAQAGGIDSQELKNSKLSMFREEKKQTKKSK